MGSLRPRTVSEYAQMLWRRKWLFVAVAGATLIAAYLIISRLPDIYESRAAIVVTGKQDERQALADRVAAVRERLSSHSHLQAVAERHLLPADAGTDAVTLDAAVNRLRRDIKVETHMRGDFPERLTLTYKNHDPQRAQAVATDLIAVFGNMNEALAKQLASESAALDEELNDIENRLNEISQQRLARRSFGVSSRPRIDLNAVRAERAAASSSIETLTDKQFALEREIAGQKQQIAEQQKIVKAAPSDARASSSYGVLLVRKAELEAQIKEFAAQYTDKNPKVIQTRTQLEEINRQIAQLSVAAAGDAPANSPEARELRTLQRELGRMETELAITQRALARKQQALESAPGLASLATSAPVVSSAGATAGGDEPLAAGSSADRLKNRYESLLRRQERLQYASITAAGLEPGLFQIVDMPSAPQTPTGPNRVKLFGLALALALGLALAVVIAFEIPRLFSIRDDRDVEYFLGAPVIVLIPESVAPAKQGRTRLLAMRVVGMVLLAAVLVPALFFLLNNLRVFHLLASR